MTLFDALNELYERYGYYLEANEEIYMHGIDGRQKMTELMDSLRNASPASLAGHTVIEIGDYLAGTITNKISGAERSTELPKSNVISYKMDNGDVVIGRPSGTFILAAHRGGALPSSPSLNVFFRSCLGFTVFLTVIRALLLVFLCDNSSVDKHTGHTHK